MIDVTNDVVQDVTKLGGQALKVTAQALSILVGLIGSVLGFAKKKCEEKSIDFFNNPKVTMEGKDSIKHLFTSEESGREEVDGIKGKGVFHLNEYLNTDIGKEEMKKIKKEFNKHGVHFAFEKVKGADDKYTIYCAARNSDAVKSALKDFANTNEFDIKKFNEARKMTDKEKANDEPIKKAKEAAHEAIEKHKAEKEHNPEKESFEKPQHPEGFENAQESEFSSWEEIFEEVRAEDNLEGMTMEEIFNGSSWEEIFSNNENNIYGQPDFVPDVEINIEAELDKNVVDIEAPVAEELVFENDTLQQKPVSENLQNQASDKSKEAKSNKSGNQEKPIERNEEKPKEKQKSNHEKQQKNSLKKKKHQKPRANARPTRSVEGVLAKGTATKKDPSMPKPEKTQTLSR